MRAGPSRVEKRSVVRLRGDDSKAWSHLRGDNGEVWSQLRDDGRVTGLTYIPVCG